MLGDPAVGPYDGADDTLVGAQNESSGVVPAITVTGPGTGLSLFDGDGLCSYGVSGCPFGPTGYEGPGTSFVTEPSLPDSAEIDFAGAGLAPGHGAYFSLEGALTSAALTAHQGPLGCPTTAASSSLSDEFGAIVCRYAADELAVGSAASAILEATGTLPHVYQIGTTNVWFDPATGELTTSEEQTIETNTAALSDALNAATSDLQDMAAEKIASRILGGEIPCAVGAVKDLVDANNSDLDAGTEFAKAAQTLRDLATGAQDASASVGVTGYDYAAAKDQSDKLGSLADAMQKASAGCFKTEASLSAEFAAAAQEETMIQGEVDVAFNDLGLVGPVGELLLAPKGTETGIPVVIDPNQFPTSVLPGLLPLGAILDPEPLLPPGLGTNTLNAGAITTIAGTGFASFSTVQSDIASTPVRLATFTTDSTGSFSGQVQVPHQTTPGKHELYAVGNAPDGTVHALGASITVKAVPGKPAPPECIGTLSGTINGALTVAPGLVCTLTNATVNGQVTVGAGAVFEADSSTLHGGVTAPSVRAFALCGDQIRGKVTVGSSVFPPLIGSADSPGCAPTTITGE